jgi:hypothetical protein
MVLRTMVGGTDRVFGAKIFLGHLIEKKGYPAGPAWVGGGPHPWQARREEIIRSREKLLVE